MPKWTKENINVEIPAHMPIVAYSDNVHFTLKGRDYEGQVHNSHVELSGSNADPFRKLGLNDKEISDFGAFVYGVEAEATSGWPSPKVDEGKHVHLTKMVRLLMDEAAADKAVADFRAHKERVKAEKEAAFKKKFEGLDEQSLAAVKFFSEHPEAFSGHRTEVRGVMSAFLGVDLDELVKAMKETKVA